MPPLISIVTSIIPGTRLGGVLSSPPVISGNPWPGETLTSTRAMQWLLDGQPIAGQTGNTLEVSYLYDLGAVISQDHPETNSVTIAYPAADRYISPTGNDSADGSEGAPWATFQKASTWANALPANSAVRIRVKTGAYNMGTASGLYIIPTNAGIVAKVDFEEGVTAITSQVGGSGGNGIGGGGSVAATFDLRGAQFTGSAQTSANGIGVHNTAVVRVYGGTTSTGRALFTGYDDGWSNHTTCHAEVWDTNFANSSKGGFTHVDSSTFVARRCRFTGKSGAILGIGAAQNSSTGSFYDCEFIPNADFQNCSFRGCSLYRCKVGTLDLTVSQFYTAGQVTLYEDCFLNYGNEDFGSQRFVRCYGALSSNARGPASDAAEIINCVFKGTLIPSPYQKFMTATNGYHVTNFNPGGMVLRDTILTGYANIIDYATGNIPESTASLVAATNAQWTMDRLCYFGNTNTFTAGLNLPTNSITSDALLGPCNTTTQSDWAIGAGSPCIGAGTGGGNIGF